MAPRVMLVAGRLRKTHFFWSRRFDHEHVISPMCAEVKSSCTSPSALGQARWCVHALARIVEASSNTPPVLYKDHGSGDVVAKQPRRLENADERFEFKQGAFVVEAVRFRPFGTCTPQTRDPTELQGTCAHESSGNYRRLTSSCRNSADARSGLQLQAEVDGGLNFVEHDRFQFLVSSERDPTGRRFDRRRDQ